MTIENELPSHVELSQHLTERAAFYIVVMLSGANYYIAATPEVRRLFNLDSHGKPAKPTTRRRRDFDHERALRDILSSVFLQLRDCVFAGIEQDVKQTLLNRMGELMTPTVRGMIETKAVKLLPNG